MLKKVIISLFLICSISIFACQYILPNDTVIRFTGVNFDSNKQPVTAEKVGVTTEYTTNVIESSLPMTFWFKKTISDTQTSKIAETTICFTVCRKGSNGTLNSITADTFYPVPLATKKEVRIPNTSNEFKLFGNYILTKNMIDSYIEESAKPAKISKGDYIIIIFSYTNGATSVNVGFKEDESLQANDILNQITITTNNIVNYGNLPERSAGSIGPGNCLIIEYTGVSRIVGR